MLSQKILNELWDSLDTQELVMVAGANTVKEIAAHCREVENDVWLLKDQHGITLQNDMPCSRKGYRWEAAK